jgi:hypothetical protein
LPSLPWVTDTIPFGSIRFTELFSVNEYRFAEPFSPDGSLDSHLPVPGL